MRLTKTLLFVVVVLTGCLGLQAQDLHNSLFYMNPLHINPSFAGNYEGTFRIGGLYRDQARSAIGSSAYSSPTIFVDAPVLMIGKRSWLGAGILIFQDKAGDGNLKMTAGQLTAAAHLAMDKKSKNIFSVGVQWGRVGRSFENLFRWGDVIAAEQLNTPIPQSDDPIGDQGSQPGQGGGDGPSFSDINAGFMITSKVNKNMDFNFGVSARHITTPGSDYNFSSNPEDLNLRFTAHAQLEIRPKKSKWSYTPELYFSNISPSSQIQLHGWAGYMLKPEENIKLNFGLGYRVQDSGQFLLGVDYGDIKAQLAYDLTLSELSDVNSSQGGFEIAVYYIGKIFKKPDVKPAILCPHL